MATETSRFEQRRKEGGIDYVLQKRGIKRNPDLAYVELEDTGSPSDLRRQRNIYYKEGYDQEHSDEEGIVMSIPKDEVAKNVKRYQETSEARVRRPDRTELSAKLGFTAGKDTFEESRPTSVRDFFRTSEKADPADDA